MALWLKLGISTIDPGGKNFMNNISMSIFLAAITKLIQKIKFLKNKFKSKYFKNQMSNDMDL